MRSWRHVSSGCVCPGDTSEHRSLAQRSASAIILLMETASPSLPHLCLWRFFFVFTDRVLGRLLCKMS